MIKLLNAAILTAALLAGAPAARAAPPPTTSQALAERLKSFDPRAVAAARHYIESPTMKAAMVSMVDALTKALSAQALQQNSKLNPQQGEKLAAAFGDVFKERLDVLREMNLVAMLDAFTTDELVALDRFYSSPEGVSIVGKMPKVMAQLPLIMQSLLPDMLGEVRSRMKAGGVELKL